MEDECDIRKRIQDLLCDYSRTHYTTNYLDYTNDAVCDFVESLEVIPQDDPKALTVVGDPMKFLANRYRLDTLEPPVERFTTPAESMVFIRDFARTMANTTPRSQRPLPPDNSGLEISPLPCPAVVTRRSLMATPKLGKGKFSGRTPVTMDECKLPRASVEDWHEPKVIPEEILRATLHLDADGKDEIRALMQATFNMVMGKTRTSTALAFLNQPEPPLHIEEEVAVPLFPRSRQPGSRVDQRVRFAGVPDVTEELPSILQSPPEVKDSDDDIARQNMRVVDGWVALSSSQDTESDRPSSSQEDEIDQLEFPLTPDTDLPIIEDTRIDVMIPRCRRIGGSTGVQEHILHGKSYGMFLRDALLPKVEKAVMPSSPEAATTSVVGQASAIEFPSSDGIQHLYDKDENPFDIVLQEGLDARAALLLDVPYLPPPTEHPTELTLPSSYKDWPSLNRLRSVYKKARISQSLALSLSWVAFTVDYRLPSIAEIVDAECIVSTRGEPVDQKLVADVEDLLSKFGLTDDSDEVSLDEALSKWARWDKPPEMESSAYYLVDSPMLLSRSERRRVEGKRKDRDELVEGCPSQTRKSSASLLSPGDTGVEDVMQQRKKARIRDCEGSRNQLQCDEDEAPYTMLQGENIHQQTTSPYGRVIEIIDVDEEPTNEIQILYSEDDKENWNPSIAGSGDKGLDGPDDAMPDDLFEPSPPLWPQEQDCDMLSEYGDTAYYRDSFSPLLGSCSLEDGFVANPKTALIATNDAVCDAVHPIPPAKKAPQTLFNCSLGVLGFANLRAAKVSAPIPQLDVDAVLSQSVPADNASPKPLTKGPPPELYDAHTFRLPDEPSDSSLSSHRYLASLEIIQRRAFVKSLREEYSIDLIERTSLNGMHLILDPQSAVIFIPLLTLSSKCSEYVELLSAQSSRYAYIYVVFEAYPESCTLKSKARASALYAYTPPILKAVKKFKRDLAISEAYQPDLTTCEVRYAFVDTVEEAGRAVRMFGEKAHARDSTGGVIWDEREWLEDEHEDVGPLVSVKCINHFAASVILELVTLDQLINVEPAERVEALAAYIGNRAIDALNKELHKRLEAIKSSSSSAVEDLSDGVP